MTLTTANIEKAAISIIEKVAIERSAGLNEVLESLGLERKLIYPMAIAFADGNEHHFILGFLIAAEAARLAAENGNGS